MMYRYHEDRLYRNDHKAENDFVNNYFTHNNWGYEPDRFKLNSGHYVPDFYDAKRDVYIEVIGTKQAYHANKHKYAELIEKYPDIKFEIRDKKGKLLDIYENRNMLPYESETSTIIYIRP